MPLFLTAERARLQVGVKLFEPRRTVACDIGSAGFIASPHHHYHARDSTWERWQRVRLLKNLEIIAAKTPVSHQRVRVVNLVLTEKLKRRLQVLLQQFDLEWCEHPRFSRGNEPPTASLVIRVVGYCDFPTGRRAQRWDIVVADVVP